MKISKRRKHQEQPKENTQIPRGRHYQKQSKRENPETGNLSSAVVT